MKKFYLPIILLGFMPLTASAQIITFINSTITFTNAVLIPALLGLAFAIFVINAVRFFVIGDSKDEKRDNAKSLAIFSISAFVLIVIFWGLINLLASSLGLNTGTYVPPDYFEAYKAKETP